MNTSIKLKSLLAAVLHTSGLVDHKLGQFTNRYAILMYHRVIPRDKAEPGMQAGMYVEPETFAMHLSFLAEHFDVIPLSEVLTLAEGRTEPTGRKPCCCITFDDGWADFYHYAYPLLQHHAMPATVFLPTDFIGTGNWFWTDRLTSIIYRKGAETVAPADGVARSEPLLSLLTLSGTPEVQAESAINLLKSQRNEKIEQIIDEYAALHGISAVTGSRAFLSWEEVATMAASGLVSFGSHTASHRILTTLAAAEIRDELAKAREALLRAGVASPEFIPFCYPNGNFDEAIVGMANAAGYHLAVTTRDGWNGIDAPLFTLNRVEIHEDMSSTAGMFGCRLTGNI